MAARFHVAVLFTEGVAPETAAAIEDACAKTYAVPLAPSETQILSAMHDSDAPVTVYRRESPRAGADDGAAPYTSIPVDRRRISDLKVAALSKQCEDERTITARAFASLTNRPLETTVDLGRDVPSVTLTVVRETPGHAASARSVLAEALARFASPPETRVLIYTNDRNQMSYNQIVREPSARAAADYHPRPELEAGAWEDLIKEATMIKRAPRLAPGPYLIRIPAEYGGTLFKTAAERTSFRAHFALRYLVVSNFLATCLTSAATPAQIAETIRREEWYLRRDMWGCEIPARKNVDFGTTRTYGL